MGTVTIETIGVAVTLTGLLGMLIGLVWWDTWPAEPSRAAGAFGQSDRDGSDDRLAGRTLSRRALH
jgi:hypothetical protein